MAAQLSSVVVVLQSNIFPVVWRAGKFDLSQGLQELLVSAEALFDTRVRYW